MRISFHNIAPGAGRPQTGWLTLLLLSAALVPSGCLVWFMNQAMHNEKLAVRQGLMEVYRGDLALAQGRLDAWQAQTLRSLETNRLPAPSLFAEIVRAGVADSIVCFDVSNNVTYPAPGRLAKASSSAESLQARARKLGKEGKSMELSRLIVEAKTQGNFVDEDGRLILPNLELMALEQGQGPRLGGDLVNTLNNYDNGMPSAQRRFLMRQAAKLLPAGSFPTLAAEDLAAQYLEARPEPPPGIAQLSAGNGRMVLLFRAGTVQDRLRNMIPKQALPAGVSATFVRTGDESPGNVLTIPAGEGFPGWELALRIQDRKIFDTAARAQIAFYVWIGALTMTAAVILALLGGGLIRRQAAVGQLRNDLLANVTHELKTPLSSMRLLVDTLLQSQPLHEQTAREYLQLIAAENLRLSRLIDNFLTFSRIERNKHVFDFAKMPAGEIAGRAAAAVRERFAAGGGQFKVEGAPNLPAVAADSDAMATVLINLLDNAWKYSGEDKQITLITAEENGNVVFAVKDNGIGLTPRETKRIFKRFYQVDQRLARAGGGCGLGLSIVQYIVQAHHGAVRVESEPGRGSTFFVMLPIAPPEASS